MNQSNDKWVEAKAQKKDSVLLKIFKVIVGIIGLIVLIIALIAK